MRATVFLAPRFVASIQAVIFWLSLGVTAMNKSASFTPTSFSPEMEEGEAVTVSKSKLALRALSFSSSSSIRIMSCFSRDNNLARWVPTLPAPAIIIFIFSSLILLFCSCWAEAHIVSAVPLLYCLHPFRRADIARVSYRVARIYPEFRCV